jgi:hypothetical protein
VGTGQRDYYVCPFCGHKPAQRYYLLDRVKKLAINASIPDVTSAGFNTELTQNPNRKFYYDCTGCEMKYEDVSDIDIGSILLNMRVRHIVMEEVSEIFGQELRMLMTNPMYRTGIVRRTRFFNAFLSLLCSKRKLIVCILYNGQRRFVSLLKRKRNNGEYYEAVSLGRP